VADTTKPLTALEEHNRHRREAHARAHLPRPNGIACPGCGKELVDFEPGVLLLSNPPHVRTACPACGWKGTRVA
jgi:hypothetical protein